MEPIGPAAPPRTEEELLDRARALAGRTLGYVAGRLGVAVPDDFRRAKGWVGQLVELALGASAGSRPVPDFVRLGVELKTIPVDGRGVPRESTHVCAVDLTPAPSGEDGWERSWVRLKLARVLWVPVQADPGLAIPDRRVGAPLLWSPDPAEEAALRTDWTELMDRVRLGQVEQITAHEGTVLQIRPKAADSRAETWGVDEAGRRIRTLPRGWYLRAGFTEALLRRWFAGPGR